VIHWHDPLPTRRRALVERQPSRASLTGLTSNDQPFDANPLDDFS
jgi:hypothetical protein